MSRALVPAPPRAALRVAAVQLPMATTLAENLDAIEKAVVGASPDTELLLFPDERHMPRGEADRIYMEEHILGFLRSALA